MKLSNLFKPKWQHSDAEIRRAALKNLEGEELTTALRHVAENDDDAALRRHAVFQLKDPEMLLNARKQKDTADKAGDVLLELLDDGANVEAILPKLDQALLAKLLRSGQPVSVMQKALAEVPNDRLTALLPDLRDESLWQAGLDRIDDETTLATLANGKSKPLAKAAAIKLHAAQLERGEPKAVTALATKLCQQLEGISRGSDLYNQHATVESLSTEFKSLKNTPPSLVERFERSLRVFNKLAREQDPKVLAERAEQLAEAKMQRELLLTQLDQLVAEVPAESPENSERKALEQRISELEAQWQALPATQAGSEDNSQQFAEGLATIQRKTASWGEAAERGQRRGKLLRDLEKLQKNLVVTDEASIKKLKTAWSAVSSDAAAEQLKQFSDTTEHAERKLQSLKQEAEAWLGKIPKSLSNLEAQLAADEMQGAGKAWAELQRVTKLAAPLDTKAAADWAKRMSALAPKMRELRDWETWSTIEERKRINNELEALAATDSSGDNLEVLAALAEKMSALQRTWKSLGAARNKDEREQDSRHDAVVKQLRSRAEPHFAAKRAERSAKMDGIKSIANKLSEMSAVATSSVDWKALDFGVRDAKRALSKVSDLPQRDRGAAAKLLRAAIGPADEKLREQQGKFSGRKEKLIEEAKALVESDDLNAAMDRVKALQVEWKNAGNSDRRTEQALWEQFRAAADAVFAKKDESRREENAAWKAEFAERETLVKQLESLAAEASSRPEATTDYIKLRGEFDEFLAKDAAEAKAIEDAKPQRPEWDDRDRPRREPRKAASPRTKAMDGLERRVTKADEALKDSQQANRAAAEANQLQQLTALAAAMDTAENSDAISDDAWQTATESLPGSWAKTMQKRRDRGADKADSEKTRAEQICLALEIAAGIDSPADAKQARMDLQVSRLNASLGSGDAGQQSASKLQRDWYSVGPLSEADRKTLGERAQRAIAALK